MPTSFHSEPQSDAEIKSRRGRGSRRKGASYERHVCRVANGIVSKLGWRWSRTPRSGGWGYASRDPSLRKLRADITVPDACRVFPEAKKRESWSLDQFMSVGPKRWAPLLWYATAVPKAKAAGKIPVLFLAKNLFPDIVIVRRRDAATLLGAVPVPDAGEAVLWFDEFVAIPLRSFLTRLVAHETSAASASSLESCVTGA